MAGERECPTGHPQTPREVVTALLVRARGLVALTVALELRVGERERVLAGLAGLADVVQVALARGMRGGLERGEPGIADRRRRQAAAQARVVPAGAVELGDAQRARPVVLGVADRGVD